MTDDTVTLTDENGEVIYNGTARDLVRGAAYGAAGGDEFPRMLDRFEQMLREQQEIADSLKDLADEAKEKGFDVAALRKAAKLRIDAKGRLKFEKGTKTLIDYMEAAGDPLEIGR